jgi:predicted GH43/DUF377 family glycosyl hydrolase
MKSRLSFISVILFIFGLWGCNDDPVSLEGVLEEVGFPTCILTSPADGDTVGNVVWLRAEAEDSLGVVKVEFIVDDEIVATDIAEPYEHEWNTEHLAQWSVHSIYAAAYDTDKLRKGSELVFVTINHESGPPAPVVLVSVLPSYQNQALVLSWTPSGEEDFHQYIVRRSDAPNVTEASPAIAYITERTSTHLTDNAIVLEQEYYYRVYVEDDEGYTSESNELSGILFDLPGECNFGDLTIFNGQNNPVLTPADVGGESAVIGPCVIYHDGMYRMWFSGSWNSKWEIGAAISPDGENWAPYGDDPVLTVGPPGSFDSDFFKSPEVIFDEEVDLYKMWYGGYKNNVISVGYAESPDGFNWTKYSGSPVMVPFELPWEGDGVIPAGILKLNGTYHMWYGARLNAPHYEIVSGYATSTDGIHWTKYSHPVFTRGSEPWENEIAGLGDVRVMPNGNYETFYLGLGEGSSTKAFGRAVSEDGIHWIRDPMNPIFTRNTSIPWKSHNIMNPCFLRDGNNLMFWYAGDGSNEYYWTIGMDTGTLVCE